MSVKMKLVSTISAFCLILGLLIIGVLAVPSANIDLGGTISFIATDVYADVSGKITGSAEAEQEEGKEIVLETLHFEAGKETDVTSWANNAITFQDDGSTVTISVTITNKSDRILYASITDKIKNIANVTKAMKIGEDDYSGTIQIPGKEGETLNSVTIDLTMKITDPDISLADGLRYGYSVLLSNDKPTEVVESNNNNLGTVKYEIDDDKISIIATTNDAKGGVFAGVRKTNANAVSPASTSSNSSDFVYLNTMETANVYVVFMFDENLEIAASQTYLSGFFANNSVIYNDATFSQIIAQIKPQLDSMKEEDIAEMEAELPGFYAVATGLVNKNYTVELDYTEGDQFEAVFISSATGTTVEDSSTGYTFTSFDEAGISFVSSFTLPEGASSDITLPSTQGQNQVIGAATGLMTAIQSGETSTIFKDEITSVNIPDGYIKLQMSALAGLTKLKTATIGSGLLSVEMGAFSNCTNLTEVTLPNTLITIGEEAFYGCISLTNITIPNSVTSIGTGAFNGCTSLEAIIIDSAVIAESDWTFVPDNTSKIYVKQGLAVNSIYSDYKEASDKVGYDYYSLPAYADFSFIENATGWSLTCTNKNISGEVTIPKVARYNRTILNVTEIGGRAFSGCTSLTSITISEGVTSIEYNAFEGCTGLASIIIPNSVTDIGSSAFEGCTGLTSITIPSGVTIIGYKTFYGCESLASITIPDSVTFVDMLAFAGCTNLEYNEKDNGKYLGNENNSYVVLVDAISEDFESFTIQKSCKVIRCDAFYGCTSLESITIPEGVISIGNSAFMNCTSLTSVTIPDSVTTIEAGAFRGCTSLASITIPSSVTSIGYGVFRGCTSLTSIIVAEGNDLYDSRNNCNAIIETATNTLIAGCKNTIIPNDVKSIGHQAFVECSSLKSIEIPDSVTSIGSSAFFYCTSLTNITIPEDVTSIGSQAFEGCQSLTDVYYTGTEEEWKAISIDSNNDVLSSATIHYNSGSTEG